jgi:hypothetical protein
MQQYCELVDCQGLKQLSAERRQRDSLKSFEHSVEVWKDWISLTKEFAIFGDLKSFLQRNCYQPSARYRVRIQQRGTQAERSSDEQR